VGEKNVSAAAVAYITERATTWKRPLTTTRNGGTLIYYGYPRMRVSFDDRSDFYGDTVNFSQFRLQELRRGWREVLAEGDYDAAVLSPSDGLRTGLESLAEWRNVFEDKTVVIFER
jgi:hypothetical protein